MEKVKKRLFLWLFVMLISLLLGYSLDSLYGFVLPLWVRVLGLLGIVVAALTLRISGRMLKKFGQPEEWGWTTKLVTHGIYSCVRHPHHFGIGLFVTSLGLLLGGLFTFLLLTFTIWVSVILFLIKVEEPEAREKFGEEYEEYKRRVPMILPNPLCLLREILKPS